MSKNALIIFIKNPVIGTVKTRLAKDIGDERALQVYRKLLAHTQHVAEHVDAKRFLFYMDVIKEDDWNDDQFEKRLQVNGDLGDKMQDAFNHVIDQGFEKVLIIGSDCPEISNTIIDDAFDQLESHDVVVGPANDGGYYLLGMTQLHAALFNLDQWSTDHVLKDTMSIANELKLTTYLLPELIDIDTLEDLEDSENTKWCTPN